MNKMYNSESILKSYICWMYTGGKMMAGYIQVASSRQLVTVELPAVHCGKQHNRSFSDNVYVALSTNLSVIIIIPVCISKIHARCP